MRCGVGGFLSWRKSAWPRSRGAGRRVSPLRAAPIFQEWPLRGKCLGLAATSGHIREGGCLWCVLVVAIETEKSARFGVVWWEISEHSKLGFVARWTPACAGVTIGVGVFPIWRKSAWPRGCWYAALRLRLSKCGDGMVGHTREGGCLWCGLAVAFDREKGARFGVVWWEISVHSKLAFVARWTPAYAGVTF